MSNGLRRLRWVAIGGVVSALVLAGTAGANHIGFFDLGHTNTLPSGAVNGLECSGSMSPCLDVVNATAASSNPGTFALRARHTATTGRGYGVQGVTSSDNVISAGVRGDAVAGSGVTGNSTNGNGVLGGHNATTGVAPGVLGYSLSNESGGIGVQGYAQGTSNAVYGVFGQADAGTGVVGAGDRSG